MTFDEARKLRLDRLDTQYALLRGIVEDPKWCNESYKPYQEVLESFAGSLKSILRLNAVENEVK